MMKINMILKLINRIQINKLGKKLKINIKMMNICPNIIFQKQMVKFIKIDFIYKAIGIKIDF